MLDLLALHTTQSGVNYTHLLKHYLQEIIRSSRPVILLPFPDMIKDEFELRTNLLAGSELFAELQEPFVIGPSLIQHIPGCLDDAEAVQTLRLQTLVASCNHSTL
jgi:hypothetical protein